LSVQLRIKIDFSVQFPFPSLIKIKTSTTSSTSIPFLDTFSFRVGCWIGTWNYSAARFFSAPAAAESGALSDAAFVVDVVAGLFLTAGKNFVIGGCELEGDEGEADGEEEEEETDLVLREDVVLLVLLLLLILHTLLLRPELVEEE